MHALTPLGIAGDPTPRLPCSVSTLPETDLVRPMVFVGKFAYEAASVSRTSCRLRRQGGVATARGSPPRPMAVRAAERGRSAGVCIAGHRRQDGGAHGGTLLLRSVPLTREDGRGPRSRRRRAFGTRAVHMRGAGAFSQAFYNDEALWDATYFDEAISCTVAGTRTAFAPVAVNEVRGDGLFHLDRTVAIPFTVPLYWCEVIDPASQSMRAPRWW